MAGPGRSSPNAGSRASIVGSAISMRRTSRGAGRAGPVAQRADGVARQAFVRGSVIVKFRTDTSQDAAFSTLREVGAATIERPSYADFDIVTIPADADPEAVAADLRAHVGRRVRAAAVRELSDVAAERHVLRPAVELPGD